MVVRGVDREADVEDVLQALPCQAAVLDGLGNVFAVNEAWRDFGESHPGDLRSCLPNGSLVLACEAAGRARLATRLADVLSGRAVELAADVTTRVPGGELGFRLVARRLPNQGGALVTCWELGSDRGEPGVPAGPAAPVPWLKAFDTLSSSDPAATALILVGFAQRSTELLEPPVVGAVVDRLQRACRPGDIVSWVDAQQLCVVATGVLGEIHAAGIAERLLDVVAAPLVVDDALFELEAWAGVVSVARLRPRTDPEATLTEAQVLAGAGPTLRRAGGSPNQATAASLDRALRDGDFVLHYQPVIELPGQASIGVEALIRWEGPAGELLFPDAFIGVAERTGRIAAIGAWVLRQACADIAGGDPKLEVAVNISANQLRSHFRDAVVGALRETGLSPERLCLEITESVVMNDPDLAVAVLGDLSRLGVKVALDDFGTGYSSLARLRHLPLHRIKIDRSFVRDLSTSALDQKVVAAIVDLGHALGLEVVAEGVEQEHQLAVLRELGCDLAQGYLFARPAPMGAGGPPTGPS